MHLEDVLAPLVEEAVQRAVASREEPVGFLDAAGAARFLSLSEDAVRTLAKRRKLPLVKLPNGRVRFEADALRAWARREQP